MGIEFEHHHRADSDSMGCAKLLLKCLETDNSTLEDLEGNYHFHRGQFAPNVFIAHLQNKKQYSGQHQYKNIIKDLEEHPELIDEGNYFYGKTICFTGKTQYAVRRVLLQMVKNIGGIPTDSVTSETDVLVVGQQDYRIVGADGMSSKQKKALKLLEKGQLIEILSESEFISRI